MENIKTTWDFVEKYFPNYSSSDEILRNNDLSKAIEEGEEDLEEQINDSNAYVYEKAIEGFLETFNEIEAAKQLLKDNGYYTDNLWCVDDVKHKFKCTDDEAQEVLNGAMQNSATMEQIWFAIDFHGQELGLEENDEN